MMQEALQLFAAQLNLIYLGTFIFLTWMLNTAIETPNYFKKMTFLKDIPKIVRVLFLGFLLMVVFIFIGDFKTKQEIFKLIITLITSMTIWKMGIDKIFKLITKKLGIETKNNGDSK